jgi:hypothetical protein
VLWVRPPDLQAALRTAELLVKTGFALVVLDLEGARPRELAQLGASVWTRLLRALRESRATALLLGTQRAAGSFATLGVSTTRERALFDAGLFEGLASRLTVLRSAVLRAAATRASPCTGDPDQNAREVRFQTTTHAPAPPRPRARQASPAAGRDRACARTRPRRA